MKPFAKTTLKFFIFLLILVFLWCIGRFFKIDTERLEGYLNKFSIISAAIIFILLYVVVTFFIWLSKDVFRIVGAILFGANLSCLLVWIAEILNAVLLFNFSRYMGKDYVERRFIKDRSQRWQKILMHRKGFLSLFLFRAIPLIPFRFLDLFMGLSPITFRRYLLVVILGSLPRIYWLQYILAAVGKNILKDPAYLMQYLLANKFAFVASLIYLILAIILGFKLGGGR